MTSASHFSWNYMNEWTKNRFERVVTSYGCNKNHDDELKKKRRPIIAPAIALRLLNTNNSWTLWLNCPIDFYFCNCSFYQSYLNGLCTKNCCPLCVIWPKVSFILLKTFRAHQNFFPILSKNTFVSERMTSLWSLKWPRSPIFAHLPSQKLRNKLMSSRNLLFRKLTNNQKLDCTLYCFLDYKFIKLFSSLDYDLITTLLSSLFTK